MDGVTLGVTVTDVLVERDDVTEADADGCNDAVALIVLVREPDVDSDVGSEPVAVIDDDSVTDEEAVAGSDADIDGLSDVLSVRVNVCDCVSVGCRDADSDAEREKVATRLALKVGDTDAVTVCDSVSDGETDPAGLKVALLPLSVHVAVSVLLLLTLPLAVSVGLGPLSLRLALPCVKESVSVSVGVRVPRDDVASGDSDAVSVGTMDKVIERDSVTLGDTLRDGVLLLDVENVSVAVGDTDVLADGFSEYELESEKADAVWSCVGDNVGAVLDGDLEPDGVGCDTEPEWVGVG